MLKIVKYPDPILKKQASEVKRISAEIASLFLQMERAMEHYQGIGLAAPQVGVAKQIIVVQDQDTNHVFLNAKIIEKSRKTELQEEGCLSLPGLFLPIKRAYKVQVACYTTAGKPVVMEAEGLAARIFQHEIDHTEGKLIIDNVSPLRRLRIKKQLKEIAETGMVQQPSQK